MTGWRPENENRNANNIHANLKDAVICVERSNSAAECWTRNHGNQHSTPICYRFEVWAFSFSPRCPSSLRCIKEYLGLDGGGNVSD